jgi:hypothetical protein
MLQFQVTMRRFVVRIYLDDGLGSGDEQFLSHDPV